jgi:5'-3' exonuclease
MVIDLIDGTYELFRHFYGLRRFNKGKDAPLGAVVGVLNGVLEMIERKATHIGVATDHVIESFRNQLWPGYKTGAGIEPALLAQFHPLEQALAAMGIKVWPMTEQEADDALAAAAQRACNDQRVEKVLIWTPDKDLAQCVRDDHVMQVDRRAKAIRNAAAIKKKFGVEPLLIPDWLALVGDAADGYPGITGIGAVGAAQLLNRHGPIESFPEPVWASSSRRPCCSRSWPPCARTLMSSMTSMNCNGEAPPRPLLTGRWRPKRRSCCSVARTRTPS